MKYLKLINNYYKYPLHKQISFYSSKKLIKVPDINKLRNIGILAHIDAGKTTTTERMLYYAGTIAQMGEVHHGNTVTDYMQQERDRGITIKSAAVTFPWKQHQFNLIDTPGHIDFTMEVEQTLNVLDGAIIILDASAGVEAQTLTVWRQADRYRIPRLIFINKMDRQDADLNMCCKSIEEKLDVKTLLLQLPIKEKGKIHGLIDIVTLERIIWDSSSSLSTKKEPLTEKHGAIYEQAMQIRNNIVDQISEWDDKLAATIIESETLDNIKATDIMRCIKSGIIQQKVVPVFCGSAYKNIGIQPLMDAVILYLPSPNERNLHFNNFEENLCARSFKIIHDKQKGPLVFFRIYSGEFTKNQKIYNIQQDISEQSQKLLIAYADDFEEIEELPNGNIAVVTGLKKTMTGDLVTNSASTAQRVKKKMESSNIKQEDVDEIFNLGAKIPEPVFFCSIEPPSLAYQSALEQSLNELQREDPSLRVTQDSESGQTVLAGMGELHLEIIKDRILKEYKIDADLGPLQISYREEALLKVIGEFTTDTKIGSSKQLATVKLSITPCDKADNLFLIDKSRDADDSLAHIVPKYLSAIKQGINVALNHGPKVGSKVINLQIMLHLINVGRGTTESVVAATATQCVNKLLNESGTTILEPIMYLEIVTPEEHLSAIMVDLNKRRADIQNVTMRGNNKMVICETPLAELMGYSTIIRTLTSGTGTFSMDFVEYKRMSPMHEAKAIEDVRGF